MVIKDLQRYADEWRLGSINLDRCLYRQTNESWDYIYWSPFGYVILVTTQSSYLPLPLPPLSTLHLCPIPPLSALHLCQCSHWCSASSFQSTINKQLLLHNEPTGRHCKRNNYTANLKSVIAFVIWAATCSHGMVLRLDNYLGILPIPLLSALLSYQWSHWCSAI